MEKEPEGKGGAGGQSAGGCLSPRRGCWSLGLERQQEKQGEADSFPPKF